MQILIWRFVWNSPNRQIKHTANYSVYTVYVAQCSSYVVQCVCYYIIAQCACYFIHQGRRKMKKCSGP